MSGNVTFERSRSPSYNITHLITIEGVKSRIAKKQKFTSKLFSCSDEAKPTEFKVDVHFGSREENWLSLFLVCPSDSVYVEKATFRIMDVNFDELKSHAFQGHLLDTTGWGPPKLLSLENLSLTDDVLCLRCQVRFTGASKDCESTSFAGRDPNFHNDILKLFSDTQHADVCIIDGGKKFEAHSLLLRFRSDYFRALFDSGMEESNNNEIQIEDVDQESFKYFLKFLYTGVRPDPTSSLAWDLLPLADRFGSESLKGMCEEALISNLSATNAIKALCLADAHCCSNLKKQSLPLIRENLKTLIASDDWKQLDDNPKLALVILKSFVD